MIYLASRAPDCVRHVAVRARAVVARGSGRGARRDSGGRFARPHAPHVATARRAVALAVIALVLLVPNVAHGEIVNSPLPNTVEGLVAPYSFDLFGRFEAAGEVIGRSFSGLTSEQKHYVLDYKNNGGNAFVDFGNHNLRNCAYESNVETDALYALFPFWTGAFSKQEIWWWGYPNDEAAFQAAQRDYDAAWQSWLEENGFGGGSGGGSSGPTVDVETGKVTSKVIFAPSSAVTQPNQSNYSYNYPVSTNGTGTGDLATFIQTGVGTVPPITDLTIEFTLDSSSLARYNTGNYDLVFYCNPGLRKDVNLYVYFVPKDSYTYTTTTRQNTSNGYLFTIDVVSLSWTGTAYDGYSTGDNFINGNKITFTRKYSVNHANTNGSLNPVNAYQTYSGYGYGFGVIDAPSEPIYPTPPTPPEIPEPDPPETKPIDDPGITLPPINFPDLVLPDIDYTVEMPTGTDVVPYLKKIIANQEDIASFLSDALGVLDGDLDNIGDALGEHCNHIQQQIQRQVYWLATELQDMFDGLEVGISNYLYRVQTKLLQGIGWEFDNLSQDVISWLKRIYSRLGGNGISKPDPTTDPIGFWDWLIKQFSDFFEDLFGKSTDGLSSLFDSLKEFFPFSLPWDILALLGLFVHEPVTPVFDLPMPVPSIVSDSRMYLIHVDCHPWDGTMQIVRALEFVFFAYHLMRMVPSWFNEIKVSGM